jgi:eukaryotic-like serine/threonine-protein kinase
MGETWLGVQRGEGGFEQRVCLKFIHESFRDSERASALFLREAAIASCLRHSNIVSVIDADARAGYLALELVDGADLRTMLRLAPDRRLPVAMVIQVAIELCKGLQYAHTRTHAQRFAGIVHRDLSPANVLISFAGEIKLTDFGIAKAIRATGEVGSAVRGKLSYMSPEQLAGRPADARSDLFSLGVLLYEMLSGARPFDGDNDVDTMQRVLHGQYTTLASAAPHAPAALADVVARLLAIDPAQRFESASAVIDALDEVAPPATVIFELARLAQAARPAHTLAATIHHGRPPAFESADASYAEHPKTEQALPSRAPWARRSRGLRPVVAFVLGLVLVGAGGSIANLLFTTRRPSNALPTVQPETATRAARPALSAASPPITDQGSRTEPSTPGAQSSLEQSSPAVLPSRAVELTHANVEIGVLPAGQVWIDGRLRGAAPLALQLTPGVHTIAAGVAAPARQRTVELAAGETQQLVFDLQAAEDRARTQ